MADSRWHGPCTLVKMFQARMTVDWRRSLTNVLTGVPMMRRQTTVSLWRHGLVAAAACLLGLVAAVGADAPKDTKFPQPIEPSTVAGLMVAQNELVQVRSTANKGRGRGRKKQQGKKKPQGKKRPQGKKHPKAKKNPQAKRAQGLPRERARRH